MVISPVSVHMVIFPTIIFYLCPKGTSANRHYPILSFFPSLYLCFHFIRLFFSFSSSCLFSLDLTPHLLIFFCFSAHLLSWLLILFLFFFFFNFFSLIFFFPTLLLSISHHLFLFFSLVFCSSFFNQGSDDYSLLHFSPLYFSFPLLVLSFHHHLSVSPSTGRYCRNTPWISCTM